MAVPDRYAGWVYCATSAVGWRQYALMATDEAAATAVKVFMGLYAVQELISIIMVIRRRNLQPLKFRDAILLTVTDLSFFGFVQGNVVSTLVTLDCFTNNMITIPWIISMPALIGRLWKLLALSMATSARVAGQFDHYILRHSWMYSSRTIWVGIALTTVVLTTIRMSMLMPINCYEPSNIRDPIYLAVWISTIAYLAYSLRATRDAFKVMAEFKALLVMLIVGFLLVAPDLAFTSFSAVVNPYKYFQFVILFAGMSWNAISTLYPTYLTYKYHQMQDTESATALDDKLTSVTTTTSTATQPRLAVEAPLKAVLTHPIGYERFKEFLRTEFSVENLLCWSAVTAVIKDCQKRVVTMDEFDQKFKDIYDLYIAPGSPNEVNIAHSTKVRLAGFLDRSRRTPQKISVVPGEDIDIFEDDGVDSSKVAALRELQREIFKLMENDSFNRFKHSKKFARFIAMEQ